MSATTTTVEAYLTAAQTAFSSGDYSEAKKQIILGEMELMKLPQQESDSGAAIQLRQTFEKINAQIDAYRKDVAAGSGTRRSQASEA